MADELRFEMYDFWFHSVRKNDVQAVDKTLKIVDEEQKNKLLNGKFIFPDSDSKKNGKGDCVNFTRAWCIAVSRGSYDVVRSFIRHGVDPCVLDCDENNVLHVLAFTAFAVPEQEEKIRDIYADIQTIVSSDIILKMLKMTNAFGMKPSEVAAHLGAFGLFLDMFETPGLHLVEQSRNGINLTQWFDITEYESHEKGNRRRFCPMFFILLLDKKTLKYPGTHELFKSDLILKWIQADCRTTNIFTFIWFLFRLVFATLVFTFDGNAVAIEEYYKLNIRNETANETCLSASVEPYKLSETGFLIVGALILCYALAAIIIDIIELGYYSYGNDVFYIYTPKGKKDNLAHFEFYRVIQAILHLCSIALVIIKLGRIYGDFDVSFVTDNIIYTVLGLVNFWSYMQFTQLLPRIGHFSITLQRMLGTMLTFLVIFVFFSMTFSEILYRIINRGREECAADFQNTAQSWYSTFLVVINMLDFTQYDVMDELALSVLHAMIVFMVGILLINFLIALFSSTVAWVDQYKDIITIVQKLTIAVVLEERLIRIIGRFYRKMQMRSFVYENGRFYITRCLVGKQKSRLKSASLGQKN